MKKSVVAHEWVNSKKFWDSSDFDAECLRKIGNALLQGAASVDCGAGPIEITNIMPYEKEMALREIGIDPLDSSWKEMLKQFPICASIKATANPAAAEKKVLGKNYFTVSIATPYKFRFAVNERGGKKKERTLHRVQFNWVPPNNRELLKQSVTKNQDHFTNVDLVIASGMDLGLRNYASVQEISDKAHRYGLLSCTPQVLLSAMEQHPEMFVLLREPWLLAAMKPVTLEPTRYVGNFNYYEEIGAPTASFLVFIDTIDWKGSTAAIDIRGFEADGKYNCRLNWIFQQRT